MVTPAICKIEKLLFKMNFCSKAILPPSNTAISRVTTRYFMYALYPRICGNNNFMLIIPVKTAPIKRRYHSINGSKKHILFPNAPKREITSILFCVTEQTRMVPVNSHMQNRKTKFNRKIYSM